MKKLQKTAAALLALTFALALLTGCAAKTDTPASGTGGESATTQIPNPIRPVDSPDDFAKIGLTLPAPAGVKDFSCSTIADESAQIQFTADGADWTLRCAKGDDWQTLAGIYYEFDAQCLRLTLSFGTLTSPIEVELLTAKDAGRLAHWTDGDAVYTLWANSAAVADDTPFLYAQSVLEQLHGPAGDTTGPVAASSAC